MIASNKRRRRIALSELSPRTTTVSTRQQPPDVRTTHCEAMKDIHDNFDADSRNTIELKSKTCHECMGMNLQMSLHLCRRDTDKKMQGFGHLVGDAVRLKSRWCSNNSPWSHASNPCTVGVLGSDANLNNISSTSDTKWICHQGCSCHVKQNNTNCSTTCDNVMFCHTTCTDNATRTTSAV